MERSKKNMNLNHSGITVAGESNTGRRRSVNEDNFLVYTPAKSRCAFALVADGISGHVQGATASSLCCRIAWQKLRILPDEAWNAAALTDIFNTINREIFKYNLRERREVSMGSAVCAAIFTPEKVIVANTGDCRFYEFIPGDNEPLRQITRDHRPDERFFDRLKYNNEVRRKYRSALLRSLGPVNKVAVDIFEVERTPHSSYLLCSDGLYSAVNDAAIAAFMATAVNARELTGKLIRTALIHGGNDNISVIAALPEMPAAKES